jgi:hypothetical protein
METGVITANGERVNPVGHCSQCGRIWTLEKEQGVCQWCGKLATCQTRRTQALRSFKSSRNRSRKQIEVKGNGYDHLEGEWLTWYKTARRFEGKVPIADREDTRHNIILELALARARDGDKPFTEAMMYRIASFVVADYWRKEKRKPTILSLENEIVSDNGDTTELMETVADDTAIDLEAWLDARTFLLGCPTRLIEIALKRLKGIPLNNREDCYLRRFRQREQKRLFNMTVFSPS